MRALVIEPAGDLRYVDLSETGHLRDLQGIVGGWIEFVGMRSEHFEMVVHEEGKLVGRPLNPIGTALYERAHGVRDVVVGPVVLIGPADDDGETTGLSEPAVLSIRDALDAVRDRAAEIPDDPRVWQFLSQFGYDRDLATEPEPADADPEPETKTEPEPAESDSPAVRYVRLVADGVLPPQRLLAESALALAIVAGSIDRLPPTVLPTVPRSRLRGITAGMISALCQEIPGRDAFLLSAVRDERRLLAMRLAASDAAARSVRAGMDFSGLLWSAIAALECAAGFPASSLAIASMLDDGEHPGRSLGHLITRAITETEPMPTAEQVREMIAESTFPDAVSEQRVLAEIVSLAVDLGIELRDVLTADEIVRAARSLSAAKSTESTQ